MAIDQVHDLQQIFRKLLHSMSRPGTISSIYDVTKLMDTKLECFDATLLSAMTLLDAEVTFHILSEKHKDLIGKISEYTLARYAPINEADFVLVLNGDTESSIVEALNQCKIGNLIDPQRSSTWIIESSCISNDDDVILTGPGIKHTSQLHVSFTQSMWEARNRRTKEYPMGIDLIFVDEKSQMVCVPRTTFVEYKGVK